MLSAHQSASPAATYLQIPSELKQPFQTVQLGARARHSRQHASGDAMPSSVVNMSPFITAGIVAKMQPSQVASVVTLDAIAPPALGAAAVGLVEDASLAPTIMPSLYSKYEPV